MSKAQWIEDFKLRIRKWIIRTLKFCDSLPASAAGRNIVFQLSKSSTSTGANHSAACRARSKKDFYAKVSIAVEECDESGYWLLIIKDMDYAVDLKELDFLIEECEEITKILSKARGTTYQN